MDLLHTNRLMAEKFVSFSPMVHASLIYALAQQNFGALICDECAKSFVGRMEASGRLGIHGEQSDEVVNFKLEECEGGVRVRAVDEKGEPLYCASIVVFRVIDGKISLVRSNSLNQVLFNTSCGGRIEIAN